MVRVIFLLVGLQAAFLHAGPTTPVSAVQSQQCQMLAKAAAQQAAVLLGAEGYSCQDFLQRTDELADEYWQQLIATTTQNFYQACQVQGFQYGMLQSREQSLQSCQEDLVSLSKLAFDLGYASCYLDESITASGSWQLRLIEASPELGLELDSLLVRPQPTQGWLQQLQDSARPGFRFGCMLGQRERLAGQVPGFLPEESAGTALEFGIYLGQQEHFQNCQGFKLHFEASLSLLDEETLQQLQQGFRQSPVNHCWEE